MGKALKDLAIALINATLILVALCLFLAWRLFDTVDGITATFAQNLELVAPLRDDIGGVREELAALRSDLDTLTTTTGTLSSDAARRLEQRVVAMEARMDGVRGRIDGLLEDPGQLVDRAIDTAADEAVESVARLRGCVPPDAVEEARLHQLPAT